MRLHSALLVTVMIGALATGQPIQAIAKPAAKSAMSLNHLKSLKPGDYLTGKPWDDPAFKAALTAVLAPKARLSRLTAAGPVIDAIKPIDRALLAWGCRAHDCASVNAQVFIEPDANRLFVCWHDDERDPHHDWWLAKGRKPEAMPPGACHNDATAVAAYRARKGP